MQGPSSGRPAETSQKHSETIICCVPFHSVHKQTRPPAPCSGEFPQQNSSIRNTLQHHAETAHLGYLLLLLLWKFYTTEIKYWIYIETKTDTITKLLNSIEMYVTCEYMWFDSFTRCIVSFLMRWLCKSFTDYYVILCLIYKLLLCNIMLSFIINVLSTSVLNVMLYVINQQYITIIYHYINVNVNKYSDFLNAVLNQYVRILPGSCRVILTPAGSWLWGCQLKQSIFHCWLLMYATWWINRKGVRHHWNLTDTEPKMANNGLLAPPNDFLSLTQAHKQRATL